MTLSKFFSGTPIALSLLLAQALGACHGDAASTPPLQVKAPEFDSARAWKHLLKQVEFGPRPSGSEANKLTRDWLVAELATYGLTAQREAFKVSTPVGELAMENVYADLEGKPGPKGAPAPMIVLASHFDTKLMTIEFIGANDGASSTGVLLELARQLSMAPKASVTYRFLFLDGEEATRFEWIDPDNRYGSKHHVAQLDRVRGARKRIKAMILLDLVGDADLQLENDSSSTRQLLNIFKAAAKDMGQKKLFAKTPLAIEDDHEAFIRAGIPSVDLIDMTYGGIDRPYWHTAGDTVKHCSEASLALVGQLVLNALPQVIETYAK